MTITMVPQMTTTMTSKRQSAAMMVALTAMLNSTESSVSIDVENVDGAVQLR